MVLRYLAGLCCLLLLQVTHAHEGIQVYQKNLHLSAEHQQHLANDINHYQNADNIWQVLRREFALPHYENNPAVQEKIQWFLNHQDYLLRSMTRSGPYLYFILQQIKKRHLPAELVLLPIIESAYNPFAFNASSGATGMWQMISTTASGYGIQQNSWYDGRRDPIASTMAALNHLAYLRSFFEGNWLLAIAAYDTGEGNVLAAIRKNINHGESTDFWSLPVAKETRDYVPQLLALAIIISHPDEYPIEYPIVKNAPYLAAVDIGMQIDLKSAAYLAGLSLKQIKHLNSGYRNSITNLNGSHKLILPLTNVAQFTENLADSSLKAPQHEFITTAKNSQKKSFSELDFQEKNIQPELLDALEKFSDDTPPVMTAEKVVENAFERYSMQPGDTLYMVRQNDNLQKIAEHFHVTEKSLVMINQITTDNPIRMGQQIIVPTHLTQQNNPKPNYTLTPGDTIYMVRRGDTLEKIAEKFHTTASSVRLANLLATNVLEEGDQLVIPTHV